MKALIAIPVLILVLAPALGAREYSPRVLSPKVADGYSLATFGRFERWRDLDPAGKAWEVFLYLTDPRTGLYPMGAGAYEGKDLLYEYALVRDPVKLMNVYPQAYCDVLGPVFAAILEGIGVGPARTVNIPGWGHVVAEVSWGGRWHYLDLDVRAAFRRPDGSLASVEEAREDPSLWSGPAGPRFFPMDDLRSTREAYLRSPPQYRYGVAPVGHTMDYVLRRGETFTRWWRPQGDRWSHHLSYDRDLRAVLEREPRGPKSKHPQFTVHSRGNGLFVYRPRLDRRLDFEDGAWDSGNVTPADEGLALVASGEGFAVFEVRSPYAIVPLVGNPETEEDDREASMVRIEGEGVDLSASLDGGLTWKPVALRDGSADLTRLVARTYGYLLRIALRGEAGKPLLRSLEVRTWVQVHPAFLPALGKGRNRMRYVTADHHGLPTRVVEIRPDAGDPADLLKHLVARPADYDPARKTERIRGECVARVAAPPGTRIAWLSAGGSFRMRMGDDGPSTRCSIEWAAEEPRDFRAAWRSAVPAGQSHWHASADVEVRLERPARQVFVRYSGDPALNGIRLYAHCIDDRPPPPAPVVIVHRWREEGVLRSREVTLRGPGEYEVECAVEPEDESIEISVPSGE
jgi:hypothetical protein